MQCFLDGRFIDEADAKVSIFDLGLLRGWGVFDFAYARGTKVFFGKEHLERFQKSARALKIILPYSITEISNITKELLHKNGCRESQVRWLLTGGTNENGDEPTFAIINERYHALPSKLYREGVAIRTIDIKREIPCAKTLNYQARYSNLQKMKQENIFELLYIVDGKVLECTTANIFFVKGNKIFTPADEILPGITRSIIIDLALKNGIKVIEKDIKLTELLGADEVFITSTTRKILPVRKINNKLIRCPGQITQKHSALFAALEKEYFG